MKQKNLNVLFPLAFFFLTFFNGTQVALAESGALNKSSASEAPVYLILVFIVWWICNSRRRRAIGGWLLFFYIQLFFKAIASFLPIFMLTKLSILTILPIVICIPEVVLGSMLLSKKFRNRKVYNLFRIALAASFGLWLIGLIMEPGSFAFIMVPVVIYAFWFLYFTLSKRVKLVFIENKWDPDTMYPPKERAIKQKKL